VSTQEVDLRGELKRDREIIRKELRKSVCQALGVASKTETLPTFEYLINSLMDKLADLMEEHRNVTPLGWAVILQRAEPSPNLSRVRRLFDQLQSERG
jgi:hypothetical protein